MMTKIYHLKMMKKTISKNNIEKLEHEMIAHWQPPGQKWEHTEMIIKWRQNPFIFLTVHLTTVGFR